MEKEDPPKTRFESEMTRMMDLAIQKLGGLESRFGGLEARFDGLEKDVSEIKSDVKVLKGQFSDVALTVIEDSKRITKLEGDVEDLKSNIH